MKTPGAPIGKPEAIREAVLAALERRRRTRSELETMLRRKGFQSADMAGVLDRLTEVGLIDDLQYARVYLERRAASKPRGARLLRGELLAKGVPAILADQAIAERRDASDPVDDALRALKPWLRRNAGLEPREHRSGLWQFLARKGFSGDVIERAALRVARGVAEEEETSDVPTERGSDDGAPDVGPGEGPDREPPDFGADDER